MGTSTTAEPGEANATTRFRAASARNDLDALMATLAPDAELVSPISGRLVFRGRADLRVLLGAVYSRVRAVQWHEELGDGGVRVILGDGRIGGVRLTDAMVVELADDGLIRRIRPHLRPWLALTLLALRLLPVIARRPGLLRRALRAG